MPFSQIIPPSPSPSESKSPLYTSVSFFLSCIQGSHCHLAKFHIYVLVYCIKFTLVLKWALNSILQSYEISLGVHFPCLWHLYFMFCPTLFSCVHLLTFHMLHKETEALSWEYHLPTKSETHLCLYSNSLLPLPFCLLIMHKSVLFLLHHSALMDYPHWNYNLKNVLILISTIC